MSSQLARLLRPGQLVRWLVLLIALFTLAACVPGTATPVPASTGTPTPTAQPTETATETAEPTQTASVTPTPADSPTATETVEPSPTPSRTRKPTATARPTRTPRPTATQAAGGIGSIDYNDLPPQAHDTIRLIERGGPFPYRQDGTVFQNREGILPQKPSGYYHEYTVKTTGSPDRGARRIVTGEAGEMYYTDDHYDSFRLIVR